MILIVSVPHTGNHFIFDRVIAGEDFRVCHTDRRGILTAGDRAKESRCIAPLRHPRDVLRSWVHRRRTKNAEYYTLEHFLSSWRGLIDEVDPHDPLYLPVDRPDRQGYLDEINRVLGKCYQTDWRCTPGDYDVTLAQAEEQALATLMEDPFFARFGYEASSSQAL